MMAMTTTNANAYFAYKKTIPDQFIFLIKGAFRFAPRTLVQIIDHILRLCPVLLRYAPIDYILPYGRCVT